MRVIYSFAGRNWPRGTTESQEEPPPPASTGPTDLGYFGVPTQTHPTASQEMEVSPQTRFQHLWAPHYPPLPNIQWQKPGLKHVFPRKDKTQSDCTKPRCFSYCVNTRHFVSCCTQILQGSQTSHFPSTHSLPLHSPHWSRPLTNHHAKMWEAILQKNSPYWGFILLKRKKKWEQKRNPFF